MPVFGACFLPALFAVMQRYKDCVNEQKEMPPFIPFLASIYINVRAYIYNELFVIPSSPSLSSFFFVFLPFHLAHNLRICAQIVQQLANSQIMKPFKPPFCPCASLCASFFGFVFFCSLLFCLPLSVVRTGPGVFPSLVSLFSVEHIS